MPRPATSFKVEESILQTLPHDPEAERNMIALGLLHPEAGQEIARAIKPHYCYDPDNARIIRAMRDVCERGEMPTLMALADELKRHGQGDLSRELPARLNELLDLYIPDENEALETWAKAIYTTWKERTAIHLRYELAQAGAKGDLAKVEELAGELRRLLSPSPTEERETEGEEWTNVSGIYYEAEGGIWMRREREDGSIQKPLMMTNWTCRIISETTLDDGGGNPEERYTLKAACQGRVVELELSREEFEGDGALARIQARLGARARINPKAQARYLLDAIKALSGEQVEERRLRSYTGWDGDRYLMANGYIDAAGWHETDHATLPGRLADLYQFTPGAYYPAPMGAFEALLESAPNSVIVPLLGAILFSPITHTTGAHPPMVHIYGATGTHKTALSCAAMALFGQFSPDKPTDTWSSSWKSVQVLGWYLASAPMLLDDFKRKHVRPEDVTKLLQNYGDGTSRGTLTQDRRLNTTRPMRCLLVSSGEDQPEGEASALARMLSIELRRGDVCRERLAYVQQYPEDLHQLTVDYIAWLAGQQFDNREAHRAKRAAILTELDKTIGASATNPGRVASNVACLYVSWDTFSRFMVAAGLWSEAYREMWLGICDEVLRALARSQLEAVSSERYSELFLETIRGMLSSRRYYLDALDGPKREPPTGAIRLGGRDALGVYLITKTAVQEVERILTAGGQKPGWSEKALGQMLDQDGLLKSKTDGLQVRPRSLAEPGSKSPPRCWHLHPDVL